MPILGNGASGPPRTFSLELFNPSNAGLLRARGDGTILRPWRVSDWNGDGKADVLWQQEATGELALWLFDGTKRIGVASLSPDRVPDRKQWVAGSGDFNGDGQTDLVFQHQTTGAVSVWLMNGLTRTSAVTLSPARPIAWRLARRRRLERRQRRGPRLAEHVDRRRRDLVPERHHLREQRRRHPEPARGLVPPGSPSRTSTASAAYHTTENGQPIDASGTYPFTEGPKSYANQAEFSKALADSAAAPLLPRA